MDSLDDMRDKLDATHIETPIKPSTNKAHHSVGNALLVTVDGEVRKLPVPSNDPNDPLNLMKWEKACIIVACCWFSVMSLALIGSLGAILNAFFAIYIPQGHTPDEIVRLLTFPSLFVGVGNYIILPLSLAYGRRPVFLLSTILLFAATIGAALQNSYQGHLAARIVQGLTTGATESLLPLMLTDITFIHQRARVFGYYWATQSIGSSILAIGSSYETTISWRIFYWVYVGTVGLGLFLVIFGAFETRYDRPASKLDGQVVVTDEFGALHVLSDEEAQAQYQDLDLATTETAPPPKKTYLEKLKPWSGSVPHPLRTILMAWVHMLESFTSPGLLFAVLVSSITLGCTIGISLTYDTVLSQIYGWPEKNVGLVNVGAIIGGIVGMAYAGWPADQYVIWLAKRNRGVHKPEHRLIMLIPPGVLGMGALLLYGFTANGSANWWGPYLGWTLFQSAFVSVLIISTTFAAEAWPKNPGPAIVVVVGTKNLASFGASYGLTPMVAEHGYAWAFGVLAGIYGGIFLLGFPIYYFNPKWREYVARKEKKDFKDL